MCRDCHRAVDGNPWLLGELGRQIAAYGAAAHGRRSRAADAVARDVVRRRLAELTPRDRAVAEALAVARRRRAAARARGVAGYALGELARARDALTPPACSRRRGERLAHGLIAAADRSPTSPRTRARAPAPRGGAAADRGRRDAARSPAHLLESRPHGRPEVSELLRRAAAEPRDARRAARGGGLPRARPAGGRARRRPRRGCWRRWARSPSTPGCPDARRRLREALREVRDRAGRVDVLTRLAALDVLDAGDAGLTQLFDRELRGRDRARRPPRRRGGRARRADGRSRTGTPNARGGSPRSTGPLDDPLLTASCSPTARGRRSSAERRAPPRAPRWPCARSTAACCSSEAHRRSAYHLGAARWSLTDHHAAAGAIDALRGAGRRARLAAPARGRRAVRGRARAAHGPGRRRRARRRGSRSSSSPATSTRSPAARVEVLVGALAERGAFEEAHAVLRECGSTGVPVELAIRHARARLCAGRGRLRRAYAEAVEAGALRTEQGRRTRRGAVAHDRRARARPPRPPRRGRRAGRRRAARWPSASARRGRSSPRCTPARVAERDAETRIALCRRALALAAGAPLDAVRRPARARAARSRAAAGAWRRARSCARAGRGRRARAPCCSPSARGASSSRRGCVRARRRSRAGGADPAPARDLPARRRRQGPTARSRRSCSCRSRPWRRTWRPGFRKLGVNSRTRVALKLAAA